MKKELISSSGNRTQIYRDLYGSGFAVLTGGYTDHYTNEEQLEIFNIYQDINKVTM